LHRHLDGNLRLETVLDLALEHDLELPALELEALRPHCQIVEPEADLVGFLNRVELMASVLADYDACRRVAYENVEDARSEGLDYVELRFSPGFMAHAHGLHPEGVVEAVCDGVAAGVRDVGVPTKLIGILSRTFGVRSCDAELEALLTHRDKIVALDLAGDEASVPGTEFVDHFRRGRDAGWRITVHAGEAAGAQSVWQALRELGATRIGHGVRATEDPALLDYLAEHAIGIESCLTSNIQTSTVSSLETHPLKDFLDRGILATINTDDPTVSGIDLSHELTTAAPAAGLTPDHIRQAQENALEIAFLEPDERKALPKAR
jgi:adenosine deaminase